MISVEQLMEKKNSNKALSVQGLTVRYGSMVALRDVDLTIMEGEYLGIIGPNGGGKTTFLKALLGLVPFDSGSIRIFNKKPRETGKLIGYVPQVSSLDKAFPITLYQVVLTGRLGSKLSWFHQYSKEDRIKADEALEQVGIEKLKDRQISELSGGEFQRMLIARALTVEPKLLLLDEPTASVDAQSREKIFSLLHDLNDKMTIVLVTHDLLAVSSYVKTLACINEKLIYHGGKEIDEQVVEHLYGCPIDLIAHGVPHRVLKEHEEGIS